MAKAEDIVNNSDITDIEDMEFWGVAEIIIYAKTYYTNVADNLKNLAGYYQLCDKKVRRTLKDLHFTLVQGATNRGGDKYLISQKIARLIVEDILYDYFVDDNTKPIEKAKEKAEELKKERHEKKLKDVKIQSKAMDDEIRKRQEFLRTSELFTESYLSTLKEDETTKEFRDRLVKEAQENTAYEKEQLEELEKTGEFFKLSNGAIMHKNLLKYQLPFMAEDEITDKKVDDIINNLMLRAIFENLFIFKEEEFRHDLYERSAHVYNDGQEVILSDGYSELTRKLENPMGNYIKLRKKEKN